MLQFPIPTALRCYKLGQALRRAIESYPEDLRVVMVGTGGLSHQVHGERSGFNNTEWDLEFLERIENDPVSLTRMTHAAYAAKGGVEGAEVIMWLVMRGALSASVALQNSEMVESLAREMLRPMLKTWLDDNLPSLVERLVRAEIQRVARGGR